MRTQQYATMLKNRPRRPGRIKRWFIWQLRGAGMRVLALAAVVLLWGGSVRAVMADNVMLPTTASLPIIRNTAVSAGTTTDEVGNVTCFGDGRAWSARKDGHCYTADQLPTFISTSPNVIMAITAFTAPQCLAINNGGNKTVSICGGKVTFSRGLKPTEAARIFWHEVEWLYPICKEAK